MTSRFRNERTTVPSVRIHLGHNGLSTTINWGRGQPTVIGNPRLSGPLPTDRFLIPGTRKDFGGGNVSDMTSAGLDFFKELLLGTRRREIEIKADLSKAKWQLRLARAVQTIGWVSLASVIAPVRKRANTAVAVRRSEITTLKDNLAATKISVNFDMETEIAEPHRRMQSTFDRLVSSQRSWSIQTEQRIDRVRARSLAGTVVSREHAILRRQIATLVDTNDLPLVMSVRRAQSMAYFYPGFVLIDEHKNSDFAVIDITELRVAFNTSGFTESEVVPSDARVIGSTWAKANKNGSRDRRFKHNRQLPILQYGTLNLSTAGGLNEEFMFSNAEATAAFAAAIETQSEL